MRILGEFSFGSIKVTVFIYNEKVSIKFERNLVEIIFKYRDGSGMNTFENAKELCTDSFMEEIDRTLYDLERKKHKKLDNESSNDDFEFPNIY